MRSSGNAELPPTRRGRARLLVLASVVLLAGTAAFWWWSRPGDVPDPAAPWQPLVRVVAGDGIQGSRDGEAHHARFTEPFGIAAAPDGTLYVADAGEAPRIRRVAPDGRVSTIAGGTRGFVDGLGSAARFDAPSALALGADGALLVADTGNHAIRRVTPDGRVTTLAGDGSPGHADGRGPAARFNGPIGVAVDGTGRVLVADTYNDRIRAIAPDGSVTTIAGEGYPGFADGGLDVARFHTPSGVAVDADGRILVADTGNGLVRIVDAAAGSVVAHPGVVIGLMRPIGIAAGRGGLVYVTDDRGRIMEVPPGGPERVLAGSTPGFRDGADARFRFPTGLAFVEPGHLVVADAGNALVRRVAAGERHPLALPPPPLPAPAFDAEAFARLPLLWPVAPLGGPHEVAGTLGEARGGAGEERFHAGIDVRAEQGTPVHAVRDGAVSHPVSNGAFGSLNEWLRIGPLTYVHIRTGRMRRGGVVDDRRFAPTFDETGALVGIRVRRGARFDTGDVIASVNAFNHVHLNVGWPGEEYNPLRFRVPHFTDTIPPTIARGGVRLIDDDGRPLTERRKGRLRVSGRVRIVVDAFDRAEGNRPNRRLGVYALGYQVLHPDGSPVAGYEEVRETIRFDRLAGDPEAARRVYASGSGIPHYGQRSTRFLYAVTSTLRDGQGADGVWDTTQLPPGPYILRIHAADASGNVAVANRDVAVTVEPEAGAPNG